MADISAFLNLSQKISNTIVNQITNVYSKSISASVTHTVNKIIENSVVNVDRSTTNIEKLDRSIHFHIGRFRKIKEETKEPIRTDSYDEIIAKIGRVEEAINKMGESIQKTETKSQESGAKIKRSMGSILSSVRDNVGNSFSAVGKGISSVGSIIKNVESFGTKLGSSVENSKILKTADALSQTRRKLAGMTGNQAEADQLQQRIFQSAQKSGTSYESTADMVLGLNSKASGSFTNKQQMVTFTELVNKSSVIGGASAEGTKGVQTSVTEAMASGTLSGEGFNNVLQNAYPIIENIASYLNKPIEAVQKMGAQGQISGEVLRNAMFASAQQTNEEFSKTPMTFEQLITTVKDKALMAFQPALQKISELTQNQDFMNMIQNIMNGLTFVGELAVSIIGVLTAAASKIVDNWSMIAPMIILIAVAFAIWKLSVLLSEISVKRLTTTLYKCPLVWIIGIIIAIITIIKVVVDHINKVGEKTYTVAGVICGILGVMGAFIWNLFLGLGDYILSFINYFANAFIGVANFFANVFKNPISSVIYLFQGMADGVLGILEGIANAIDFVFGGNLSGTVAGWRDGLKDMADAAVQKLAPEENYEEKFKYIDLSMETLGFKRADYKEWWEKGNVFGDKINDLFKGSTDDGGEDFKDWEGILENTEKIAHNTELQPDDLSYLLELAERDAINRFTTAEVKIDMGGIYNTVSSKQNLDGIVEYLTDKLREELNNTARACNA